MTVRCCVFSDRVLGRVRWEILAGDDADPNNPVVPFVGNDDVLWLYLTHELPDHLGRARTGPWRALPIFRFQCSQYVVFAAKVSVIGIHQPAEANAAVLSEQVPVLGAYAGGNLPHLDHERLSETGVF